MLNIGHNAIVMSGKVLAILPWGSAPVKAIKKTAKESNNFIDATYGKPTRSLIIMSENVVIGSSVLSDTLKDRLKDSQHKLRQPDP